MGSKHSAGDWSNLVNKRNHFRREEMFESKEEVNKAMMDLKIFEAMDNIAIQNKEYEENDESEEILPQIFPSHDALSDRFCKTLYYGKLPTSDRPSLNFTHVAVDQFTSAGLDALGDKLGRLDMVRAADITRNACAGPNSLVLALLYLDKLRKRNPDYLTTVSSADLFLVSLMVASKFLHDDGEEDEVFNDEWASSGGIDTKELNRLELSFLSALDWRIYVDNQEFQMAVDKIETDIAFKEVTQRGWASYTDFEVLSMNTEIQNLWNIFISYTMKMTAVCVTAYAAGILSLLGTAAVLNKTSVGPAAVSSSIKTLASSLSFDHDNQETLDQVPDFADIANEPVPAHVTPADLLKASLLVTTLTAGVTPHADKDLEEITDITEKRKEATYEDWKLNQTQAAWLSDYSKEETKHSLGWDIQPPDQGEIYDHPWIQGHSGSLHLMEDGRSSNSPGTMADTWSQLMMEQKPEDYISTYLGRCPVLKWSSRWRQGWMGNHVSWIHSIG